ncbi:hypothetical protein RIF29_04648 [Crotalaria pallida]|uniref:Uncharacterized protein n=1 Tax=Crotalaria pallida TaxID=3830 RepID=A0AAN9J299_CROPI
MKPSSLEFTPSTLPLQRPLSPTIPPPPLTLSPSTPPLDPPLHRPLSTPFFDPPPPGHHDLLIMPLIGKGEGIFGFSLYVFCFPFNFSFVPCFP